MIDSRHEPQKMDLELLSWFGENELPFVLVFTKSDKLSKAKKQHNIKHYQEVLLGEWEELPLINYLFIGTKTWANGITAIN